MLLFVEFLFQIPTILINLDSDYESVCNLKLKYSNCRQTYFNLTNKI